MQNTHEDSVLRDVTVCRQALSWRHSERLQCLLSSRSCSPGRTSGRATSVRRFKADSHYPSRIRSVAERNRSVKVSHVSLNELVHTDRNVCVAERDCLTWRHRSPVCACWIPTVWTVLRPLHWTWSVCLQRVLRVFVFKNGWKINRTGA